MLTLNLGANSGIGKVVARELGARGATVHMICRNQAKGDTAVAEIVAATGQSTADHFIVHQVDMSSLKQVKQFAQDFMAKNSKLDCLINNAGCLQTTRLLTPDGLESSFACNLLGPYVLTECLIPLLNKTSGARVVTVTSAGMLTERLDANDPQSATCTFNGERAYAKQKRAQVEITHHWATSYPAVLFYSVHPGWVDTPGLQSSMPSFYSDNRNRLRTPEQGADSVLWCAATPAAMQLPNGCFIEDRRVASEHVTWAGTTTAPGDLQRLINYLNETSSRFPVVRVPGPTTVTEKPVVPLAVVQTPGATVTVVAPTTEPAADPSSAEPQENK
jgi:dehydrogenase/reductase SDR family protein 12